MRRKLIWVWLTCLLLFLCPAEAEAVTTHLRIAFNVNQAPYHFLDGEGKAAGLHIDMLERIAGHAGYELEYFPMETATACLEALESGEVDLVLEVSSLSSDDAWVTTPLSEETVCAVMSSADASAGDRSRTAVSAFQLGTITPAISAELNTSYALAVGGQKQVVDLLLSREVDIVVGLKESLLHYLEERHADDRYTIVQNYMGIVSFSARVPENDYHLLQVLNREISALRASGDYEQLRGQWISEADGQNYLLWLKAGAVVLTMAVSAMVLYVIFTSYIRRTLRMQVDKQTAALQMANQEIQEHLERLEQEGDMRRRIIRTSWLGMVLFDQNYEIKLINNSALALIGQSRCPVHDVRQLKIFGEILAGCTGDLFSGKEAPPGEKAETILLDVDGVERQYRYNIQKILKSGSVSGILLAVEDITDEETRRHELFEAEKNRVLNQVIAGVAHEIKNPLTSIRAFTEAAKEAGSRPEFLEDFARYVPSEVDRINRLVESLISYAKPAKGVKERVDLSALLQECVFFAEGANRCRQISVEAEIAPGHYIYGSRDQIKQVVINIILNGMESMREKVEKQPEAGQLFLRITLTGEERCSAILIRDEGMGMSEQAIERCMDPFFTTKRAGTGLGLTLSKQYVQENNGHLLIRSQVGQYTEIRITFRREL